MDNRFELDNFDDGAADEFIKPKKAKRSNKPLVAVIVSASIVILLLIGFILFLLFGREQVPNEFLPGFLQHATTAPVTIAEPTTVPPTTEAPAEEATYEVPNVVGLKAEDAYSKLNMAGVKYTVSRQYSEIIDPGYVISQSPQDGTIRRSEQVILYISKGVDVTDPTDENGKPAPTKPASTKPYSTEPTEKKTVTTGDYILDGSDSRYISRSELTGLSKQQLNYALNEIYARHGRKFSSSELQNYFNSKSWYKGTISPSAFDESTLNKYEAANVGTIVSYMAEKGYR